MRRWRAFLTVAALAMAAFPSPLGAQEAPTVLVYTGGGAIDEGYTSFEVATGKAIETSAVRPVSLSGYDCIVLPANSSWSEGDLDAFSAYVNGGGRLLALGEGAGEELGFPEVVAAMNDVANALDSTMDLVAAEFDPWLGEGPFPTTSNIDTSPFTFGVESVQYAYTSGVEVVVGPTAHSLVRTGDIDGPGTTFIGIEQIGSGVFALSGDTNVFSDNSDTGYTGHDNGTLAANICDGADFGGPVSGFIAPGGTLVSDSGVTGPDNQVSARIILEGDGTPGIYTLSEFFDSAGSSKGAAEYEGPDPDGPLLVEVSCDESKCPEGKKDTFILVKKLNPDGTEVVLSPCGAGIIIKGNKTIVGPPCVVSVVRTPLDAAFNPGDLVWTVRVLGEDPIIKAR